MSRSFVLGLFSAILAVVLVKQVPPKCSTGGKGGGTGGTGTGGTGRAGRRNSLVCETCASKHSTSCSGPLKTCEPSDDVCLSNAAEYRIGDQIFAGTFKECSSSAYQTCKSDPFTMTFGPNKTMRTSFSCCKTDNCNSVPIELPSVQEEFNGLECPSCFTLGLSPCLHMDIMKCRGNEDHCFEISGTLIVDKTNFTKTGAGCASAGVCFKKPGVTNFSKNAVDILTKFVCYPATMTAKIKTDL